MTDENGYDFHDCSRCHYYRPLNSGYSRLKVCHHIIETGICRARGQGECLSFIPKTKTKRRVNE